MSQRAHGRRKQPLGEPEMSLLRPAPDLAATAPLSAPVSAASHTLSGFAIQLESPSEENAERAITDAESPAHSPNTPVASAPPVTHHFGRVSLHRVQAQLAVSQPGDPAEREAEQIAEEIAGETASGNNAATESDAKRQREPDARDGQPRFTIHRAAMGGGGEAGDQLETRLRARAGAGQPLPDDVRSGMSARFGFNFADVRIHTNDEAVRWNRDLNARAFTYGKDIYFNAGTYDPVSSAGRRLLAHELTHVVQQTGAEAGSVQGADGGARSVARAVIQRDLTDDQKKSWTDQRGDQIVGQIKTAVEGWKTFRQKPEKYGEMPKQSQAASDLAELLRTLGMASTAYGQYAADQLGAEAVAYLTEMAAFMPEYRILVGAVPGVAYVPPAHHYKMQLKHEGPTPEAINPFITVEYTNAFNWHWTQTLLGMQLSWSVGISTDMFKKKKEEGGNPLVPQPGLISISSNCVATPTGYWGYQDLAGPVLIANGPKLSGTFHGFGGKVFTTGGIISITGTGGGPPGNLDFMNLEAKVVDLQFKTAENEKDLKKDFEVSLSLVEAAAGAVVRYGTADVAVAELQPTPVPEEKVWRYVYSGFETGSAEAPIPDGEVKSVLDLIQEDIADKRKNVESIKPYLEQGGIRQDFKLDFYCEGYASRRWVGAGMNDKARLEKNQELSERRAQNVTSMLNATFGPEHTYGFVGKGAAIDLPQPGKRFGELVAEEGNETLIEQLIRERAEQYMKDRADLSPDEARKAAEQDRKSIEANLDRTSDNPFARRVNITVTWSGYNVQWGALMSPEPKKAE